MKRRVLKRGEGGRTFGDNHKVKLGKEHSETNGIKLGKMTSSFWVAPDALRLRTSLFINRRFTILPETSVGSRGHHQPRSWLPESKPVSLS